MNLTKIERLVADVDSGEFYKDEAEAVALEVLEKVISSPNSDEIHITVKLKSCEEKPYYKPMYFLTLGKSYVDESSNDIDVHEPEYFGSGFTLLEAIRDLLERNSIKKSKGW